jgi:hypothetical protein
MKSIDQRLLAEAYNEQVVNPVARRPRRGVAVDIYLRRESNFQAKKQELYKKVKAFMKQTYDQSVLPFGDTLSNGSSVLELTVPYFKGKLDMEVELLDKEQKRDYENDLRGLGIDNFDVYAA